jgi:hypothetical protein
MTTRRFVSYALVCLIAGVRAGAADALRLQRMLDEAERVRASDKPRARQMLDKVERAKVADPAIVARVQLLECKWADDPAASYRAVEIGLPAAERAGSAGLRANLMACRAGTLMAEGKGSAAEQEYLAVAAIARQLHDLPLEAEAVGDIGFLQYNRGAMADALANLQTSYRLFARLGDEKGRLEALSNIANVYADAHVGQYDAPSSTTASSLANMRNVASRATSPTPPSTSAAPSRPKAISGPPSCTTAGRSPRFRSWSRRKTSPTPGARSARR